MENKIIKTEDTVFDAKPLGGVGNVFFNYMKKNGPKIAQVSNNLL